MSDHDHQPEPELARLRELAVGFALSELDDDGLRELHGLLAGPRGDEMAQAAWEQLDGAVDLRVQLGGPSFAEAVRLRLADDGTFARTARRRLGLRPGLEPVDPPPPRPRRWLRRALWFGVPMLVSGALTVLALRAHPPAVVVAVVGTPLAGGALVAAGDGLGPAAALAAPAGTTVHARWRDGGEAVISGPASALVMPEGLTLSAGTVWAVAGAAGWTLGTPDRRLHLPPGARVVAMVADGVTALAVPERGQAIADAPAPGRLEVQGVDGAWPLPQPAAGVLALPAPWWSLHVRLAPQAGLLVAFDPEGGALRLAPAVLDLPDGRSLAVGEATAGRELVLRLRGRRGELTLDGAVHEFTLLVAPMALRIEGDGAAAELRVGPPHDPPLPLADW